MDEKGKKFLANIIENGTSDYVVLLPENASECNLYAAEELTKIIKNCTGVKLTVVQEGAFSNTMGDKIISIGETRAFNFRFQSREDETLNGDGFYLKTFDDSLFICGAKDRGTLYGVYEFVERTLGVKFVATDCTVFPNTDVLPLYEYDEKCVPDFKYRGVLIRATNRKDADLEFYARSRQSHEFNFVTEKYGGAIPWFKGVNVVHNTLAYVPENKYFATKEQREKNAGMYLLKDGKPHEICWTNGLTDENEIDDKVETSSIKAAIESLKEFIKADLNAEFFPFGQEDNNDGFCSCPRCQMSKEKYTAAGTVLRFVNRMTVETQKWLNNSEYKGKKVKLVVFSYQYTKFPPVKLNEETGVYEPIDASVVPNQYVWLRMAPLGANQYYTLSEEKQTIEWSRTYLKKWSDITDRLMVWTYGCDYHNFLMYTPTIQKIKSEFENLKKINVEYAFMQLDQQEANDVSQIMNHYAYSRLMWDVTRDPYELRREFIKYYFGAGSEIVQGIYEFMDEYYLQNELHSNQRFSLWTLESVYHPIKYLEYILNECDRAIETLRSQEYTEEEKETYIKHVEQVKLTPLYWFVKDGDKYYVNDEKSKLERRKQFRFICDKLGVDTIGEKVPYKEWIKQFPV